MKKNDYLLSVIIPVYNVEQYIDRCVLSIANQANDEVEIILVDDGSSDSSGQKCDYYRAAHKNIKVIHKNNGGLSSARNAGIEYSHGKYLFFLDSDDSVYQGFIKAIMDKIKISMYDIIEFKPFLEKKYNEIKPSINQTELILTQKEEIERILLNRVGNQICFKVYRKSLFNDIRFPLGKHYEDISTTYKLILKARSILFIDAEYYIYNITNQNSITKMTNTNSLRDMLDAVDEMCTAISDKTDIDSILINSYKNNMYIYMYIKLWQGHNLDNDVVHRIKRHLDNNKVALKYIECYTLKKLIFYKFMHLIRRM